MSRPALFDLEGDLSGAAVEPAPAPLPPRAPYVIIFLSSLGLMMIEMAAGRFVARDVGASLYSWTTVIGIIFGGMSLGNYLGGRIAVRHASRPVLGRLLLLASVLTVSILWVSPVLKYATVPSAWASEHFRLDGWIELTPASFRAMQEDGVPSAVLERVRTLAGETFDDEVGLRWRLKDLLASPDGAGGGQVFKPLTAAEIDALVARSTPRGPAFQAIRESGVPEDIIDVVRPLVDREFLRGFDLEVAERMSTESLTKRYTKEVLLEHWARIVAAGREWTVFQYPVRLLLVIALTFFAPALALGLISPVVAAVALETGPSGGRTMGSVYAWGAWGSIVGTFLVGFYLVSHLGSFQVVVVTALLLAGMGLAVDARRRLHLAWVAVLAVLAVPSLSQIRMPSALEPKTAEEAGTTRGQSPLTGVAAWIDEIFHTAAPGIGPDTRESDYQFIQVAEVEKPASNDGIERQVRKLSLDHLVHGYVALAMPQAGQPFDFEKAVFEPFHLEYDYEQAYAVVLARALAARFRRVGEPSRLVGPGVTALFLGGGAYTFQRYLTSVYEGETAAQPLEPMGDLMTRYYGVGAGSSRADLEARVKAYSAGVAALRLPTLVDVAELDPMVTRVNFTRLKLATPEVDPRIKTWSYDARNFVEAAVAAGWSGRYDVVFGDAFNHYSVPYHLTTREFNGLVRQVLKPGGVYLVNVIDRYGSYRFVSAYVNTLRQTFKHVYVVANREGAQHVERDTFVVAACDRPINLDFPGGFDEYELERVKEGDVQGARYFLEARDARAWKRIEARVGSRDPVLLEALTTLDRVDRRVLGLPEVDDGLEYGKALAERRLSVRESVALTGDEVLEQIIRPGRPPGFGAAVRNMVLVRALLGRPSMRYEVTDEALKRIEATLPAVAGKLKGLEGERFESVDALMDRLAGVLTREELVASMPGVAAAAKAESRRAPVVLTDDHAPVDELLAPLFDDR